MKAKTQKNKFVLSSDLVTVEPEPIIYDIAVPAPKKEIVKEPQEQLSLKISARIKTDFHFTRVRLMNLVAGQCMSLHTDTQPRIHIPIVTNEQCLMIIDNEVKHMPAKGSAWLTNTLKTHTALNANLTMNRIHILFDLI